jgi:2',3'-cyclic-nucleotide 2'-phosphodiesterase / phosphoenolpyruvate phosphatase
VRVLFIGDVFGKPGRGLVAGHLPKIRGQYDFVVANAENAAGGFGLNKESFTALTDAGVDAVTLGNHAWDNKEIYGLADDPRIIRPLNLSPEAPGRGWGTFIVGGERITLVNLLGRVFMNPAYYNPYDALDSALENPDLGAVLVDFHAEATSEKVCLAYHFDGRIAGLIGTHTHVATADTRFLPGGTAFQSDSGMTGPLHSSIGMSLEGSIYKLRTGLPMKTEVAQGISLMNAVALEIVEDKIRRIVRYRYREGDAAGQFEGEAHVD